MKKTDTIKLTLSALFVAAGVIIPRLFHFIPGFGGIFLPMHIPVILCGLICGPFYGAICGFTLPLLSSFLTNMPPIYPIGISMMFELFTYGIVSGLLIRKINVYYALIAAMMSGRIISGAVNFILLGFSGKLYGLNAFISAAFLKSWPGIIIQLILIPPLIILIKRKGVFNE